MTPDQFIKIVQWRLQTLTPDNTQDLADEIAQDATDYLDDQAAQLLREVNTR